VLSDNLASSLAEWTRAIGRNFVETSEQALQISATFETWQRVPAILRPADVRELQECVRIANRFRVPLYPISSGKNWGYGSRVPPADGCVLLDLSRMNRILDFNEDLGFITVEPGVTQRQVYEYLKQRNSRLWMDATGSSPDCSLIGNAMERGFGHTPYGDHFSHVCGLQVLLPNGELIETGSAAFRDSTTGSVNRWGVGPSLDGLFSQSNLGIVTRMTVWLMPEPQAFEAFFFRSESPDGLPALIDVLRGLRMRDVLRSSVHIGNDYKVLAGIQQYPWAETNGRTPLTPDLMGHLRSKLSFGYWNASGGLYGTARQVSEAKAILRKSLAPQAGKLKFLNPKTLQFAKRFAGMFRILSGWDMRRTVELVEPVLGLMRGVPTEQPLASAYWRKRGSVPTQPDPDRDRCGLLWYAPVAAADGRQVGKLTELATSVLLDHSFEPMISLTLLTPRSIYCVISISYDRDIAGEDEKAMTCYNALSARCVESGFYPYRLGIQSMGQLPRPDAYRDFIHKLKTTIDPNGILAPGRYEEQQDETARIRVEEALSGSKRDASA
jgi:4-cresol dehydrogenase (hydroxylating)